MGTAVGRPAGRPSSYDPSFADWARKLARLGATVEDLAEAFGVTPLTVNNWRKSIPEFSIALKEGKELSDAEVADKLYTRAIGYTRPAVKIVADAKTGAQHIVPYLEHVPPDVTAQIFWLKNRRPDLWRDKHEHEVGGKDGKPIVVDITLTPSEAFRKLKEG